MSVLINKCQQEIEHAASQQIEDLYREIQDRCQLAFDILSEPDCEMNEDLFHGILHLMTANRKLREEIYGFEGEQLGPIERI